MLLHELEHVIRAAADVTGEPDIVVIGSQAILATDPHAPASLSASMEADIYPREHPEGATDIDGALGEYSSFHESFRYYAHGVGPETAKAPAGWQTRLIPISTENTRGATGWCMEPHDIVLSKLAAGRDKDLAFARAAIARGLVDSSELRSRAASMPLDQAGQHAVQASLTACLADTRHALRPGHPPTTDAVATPAAPAPAAGSHTASAPGSSPVPGSRTWVNSYTRADGTVVRGHYRCR